MWPRERKPKSFGDPISRHFSAAFPPTSSVSHARNLGFPAVTSASPRFSVLGGVAALCVESVRVRTQPRRVAEVADEAVESGGRGWIASLVQLQSAAKPSAS
eukprot:scaffold1282_cov251-Pinguiococcus_pyrenoidosus.AAC.64